MLAVEDGVAPLATAEDEVRAIVVVPARDEEARIGACLAALTSQRGLAPSRYEVIVVLDGCSDRTRDVVTAAAERRPYPRIHTVELPSHRGVGRARRIGMDLAYERLSACGDDAGLIASTDADAIVADDWLSVQLELVSAGTEAIGGQIDLDPDDCREVHAAAISARSEGMRARIDEISGNAVDVDHPHFSGASMALTVNAYRRCGGLPVRAALEDEALARALMENGIAITRSRRVRVRTSARRDGRAPRGLAFDLGAADWRARRSFTAGEFPLERLLAEKCQTISLVLPAREVERTIGTITGAARELADAGLFDEVLVIDAGSRDNTVAAARQAGVEVVQEDEVMSAYGGAIGKGDAMWRGLAETTGEIVVFADTDTEDFGPEFLLGLVGPLVCDPEIAFVKGAFTRPFRHGDQVSPHGGGRVTELMARPLLNLHLPELAVFEQPLAGETAARRSLLERIPFAAGYGVEIAMLIDAWRSVGRMGMAQVDLGSRQNRHQPLRDLSAMSYAVLAATVSRVFGTEFGEAQIPGSMLLPSSEQGFENRSVALEERPPLITLRTDHCPGGVSGCGSS